jgi:hypothetical protein
MNQIEFLNLTTQPAIWDAEQTGWFLNMSREDVLLLCRRKHLPALADPPPGAQRYFWGKHVRSLAEDEKWLKKAILILRKNVTEKNAAVKRRQSPADGSGGDGHNDAAKTSDSRIRSGNIP